MKNTDKFEKEIVEVSSELIKNKLINSGENIILSTSHKSTDFLFIILGKAKEFIFEIINIFKTHYNSFESKSKKIVFIIFLFLPFSPYIFGELNYYFISENYFKENLVLKFINGQEKDYLIYNNETFSRDKYKNLSFYNLDGYKSIIDNYYDNGNKKKIENFINENKNIITNTAEILKIYQDGKDVYKVITLGKAKVKINNKGEANREYIGDFTIKKEGYLNYKIINYRYIIRCGEKYIYNLIDKCLIN